MNYFNPSDLVKIEATFNYITKSGVGFGILPNNEQVFIPGRIVDSLNLNIGDSLTVWAIDNYASEESKHYASRWRAIRVEVNMRVSDLVSHETNRRPAPARQGTDITDLKASVTALLEEQKCPWTPNALAYELRKENRLFESFDDLPVRVGNLLQALHNDGHVACLKVHAGGRCTAVYYAKDVDTFYDHLDTPLGDE